jgi:hypothetical protein
MDDVFEGVFTWDSRRYKRPPSSPDIESPPSSPDIERPPLSAATVPLDIEAHIESPPSPLDIGDYIKSAPWLRFPGSESPPSDVDLKRQPEW